MWNLLAQEENNLPKIIFGLIFFAIWAISALASWLKKQQEAERRRRVREQIERGSAGPMAPVPMRPPPRPVQAPRTVQAPRPVQSPPPLSSSVRRPAPRPIRQPAKVRRPPPSVVSVPVVEHVPPTVSAQPVAAKSISESSHTRHAALTTDARAIAQWMRPATLRSQFILTEILQPPLALRPARDL